MVEDDSIYSLHPERHLNELRLTMGPEYESLLGPMTVNVGASASVLFVATID